MARYEVREFAEASLDDAAQLLAGRHRRQSPGRSRAHPVYEQPAAARAEIEALQSRDDASGVIVYGDGSPSAFILGTTRSDPPWGPNVWVEDAGSAANDGEALREAYAAAAAKWVANERPLHFVNIPATDQLLHDAWFSLSFGLQHVHAIREPVAADFKPRLSPGLLIRKLERADLPAVAELGLVLPRHAGQSPVFATIRVPTYEEVLAEAEEEFGDPRFAEFVAEHAGRIVGTAIACSIEESSVNTRMMRPASASFLGHAAVSSDARGLGVGRALGDTVMAWSRDQGHEWVATDWRSTNLEANRTWVGLGFRPSFHRLHRAIV